MVRWEQSEISTLYKHVGLLVRSIPLPNAWSGHSESHCRIASQDHIVIKNNAQHDNTASRPLQFCQLAFHGS